MQQEARVTIYFIGAGAGPGLLSIAGAALGTAGWRNRKSIRNSISDFPSNARNRMSSISERFRNPRAYQAQNDLVPEVTGSPVASVALQVKEAI